MKELTFKKGLLASLLVSTSLLAACGGDDEATGEEGSQAEGE